MRLIFLPILIVSVLSANGQALWRNFFSTNQNPRVTAVAGSNVTVQASTVGSDQRIFTINSVPPTNVAYSGFATNANFATNASNTTNFWGILSPTNIPSLAYISNNVGNGTNVTLWGSNNVSRADGLGTTVTPTIWLTNGTAAAAGAQQYSPVLMLGGQGWKTTGGASVPVSMGWVVVPVQGSANPTATMYPQFQVAGGSIVGAGNISLASDGTLNASLLTSSGSIRAAANSALGFSGRTDITSPAAGDIELGGPTFNRLFFGAINSSWPALKVETTNSPTLSVRNGADTQYASLLASNITASASLITTNGLQSYNSNNVVEVDGLGTTIAPALWLTNGTAAALGAQQTSPALMLGGQGWRSGNSTTMPIQMGWYVLPVQGSGANPTARLTALVSVSNAAPSSTGFYINDVGGVTAPGASTFSSYLYSSTAIGFTSKSIFKSGTDGDMQILNSGENAFSRLFFGPLNSSWPALKVETTNSPTLSVRNGADNQYASLMASNITATGTVLATNIVANGTGTNIFAESLFTNNLVVSGAILATNYIQGSYGCFAMGTGVVAVATSTSTNVVGSMFNYVDVYGTCGNETNSNIVVTNAGKYRISFGAGIAGANNPASISLHLTTNGTPCDIVWVEASPSGTTTYETGFKEFVVTLPANCRVSLAAGNGSANGVNLRNVCLNVKGAN